jgi:hypothetical protein
MRFFMSRLRRVDKFLTRKDRIWVKGSRKKSRRRRGLHVPLCYIESLKKTYLFRDTVEKCTRSQQAKREGREGVVVVESNTSLNVLTMLNVFGCSEKKVTECVDETRQGLSF